MMLCKTGTPQIFDNPNWIYQIKYDGERAVLKNGELINRRGRVLNSSFPEFENFLRKLQNCTLDGEIVVEGKGFNEGIARRIHIQDVGAILERSRTLSATYYIFDILEWNGESLLKLPLRERLKALYTHLEPLQSDFLKVAEVFADGSKIFDLTRDLGKEGIIAKNLNSAYSWDCRSDYWLKIKHFKEADIKVRKYEPNPKGITVESEDGIRCAVLGKQSEWVKEQIDREGEALIEIQYLERTQMGKYRHPSFIKLKGDLK